MNIGEPRRVIEIEPVSLPVPEEVPVPAPDPDPAAPARRPGREPAEDAPSSRMT